jgi:transcription elongation factor Elf1/5S rRNA maturation endonuclease (ribonuclease M5)
MTEVLNILERLLGSALKTPKDEYLFHCSFCHHRKKKLSVNLGSRFGVWKCWVCGRAGRKLVSLLYAINAPREYIDTIRELDPEYKEFHTPIDHDIVLPALPIEYIPLYQSQKTYTYIHALKYVLSRGFDIHDILKHKIGYCESGKYEGRLIIPSYDKTHMLNYFVSRSFYPGTYGPYKNPPLSKNIIMFENMINWNLPVILVEGVFDAITIRQNAIPLLGKFIGSTLMKKLLEVHPPEIYVLLDTDAQEEAVDLYKMLESHGLSVKNVVPTKKDANELGFENVWKQIDSARNISFKDMITQKLYDFKPYTRPI